MSIDYQPYEIEAAKKAVQQSKFGGAKIAPRKLLLGVLAEVCEPMCQAVDQYCGLHTRDIESHIVSAAMGTDEMQMKLIHLKEADEWFTEYGCTVCDLGPRGYKLTDCAKGITGSSIRIEHGDCFGSEHGVGIGAFHTHPYGLPAPSYGDIMSIFSANRKINFIGGMVAGHKVITGCALRPESAMKWEMKQRIEPYEKRSVKQCEYVINFVYRPPGATSADELSVKSYETFIDEDKEMNSFITALEYLESIFDVVVHWC